MQSRGVTGIYVNNIAQDGPLVNVFTYTPNIINALEAALSSERLTAYLQAMGGHQERALRLYLWNTEVSAAFYGPLQGLEIALRNALHRELSRVYGASWYDVPSLPLSPRAQSLISDAKAAIAQGRKSVIPPRVVAELSLGFWIALLGPGPRGAYEMRLWRPMLYKAFPHAKLSRKAVHQPLDQLRLLRNRIAHHEPIFQRPLLDEHQRILEVVSWISPEMASWIAHHSTVPGIIAARP
jgi:hypothetical protein